MTDNADQNPRVLIIDDDEIDRENIHRMIGGDYDLIVASGGEQGLQSCFDEDPSCVLLDYNLPDLNGLTFLSRLRSESPKAPIPVIMMTGAGDETIAVEAMKRGATDYLIKGQMNRASLHRAVRGAIERKTLVQRLDEKQREIQAFAHTAAHDLKAPLRRISAFCQLLDRHAGEILDEKGKGFIKTLKENAEQLRGRAKTTSHDVG